MLTLKTSTCYLRALEPEDLDFIYEVENDESIWQVSNTITPYSRYLIKEYLEHAHKDIYEVKQLRLVICSTIDEPVGLIDLFDYDPKNHRAGIGILIKDDKHRSLGYGKSALTMIVNYAFKNLNLHQLYCSITDTNTVSVKLFESVGFKQVGLKKDWNFNHGEYSNEYLYQLINNVH